MNLFFKLFKQPGLNKKLQVAVMQNDARAADKLIRQGANSNKNQMDSYMSLLGTAVEANNVELVKVLLRGNPDLETQTGSTAMSPLGEAAIEGYADIVELLLTHGADPTKPNRAEERMSPLLMALQHDNQDMAHAMLSTIDRLDLESSHDLFCLEVAIAKARADNVVSLLSKCPDETRRYLLSKVWMAQAAARGRESVVRAIIDSGIDYNLSTELRKEDGPRLDQVVEEMGHDKVAALLRERDSGPKAEHVPTQTEAPESKNNPLPEQSSHEVLELDPSLFFERMRSHRDRIDQASPAHRVFTAEYFDDETLNTLTGLAADKMQLTQSDETVHSISIASDEVAYTIYTMPMSIAQAGQWYATEYGGYMLFLNRMAEVPAINSGNPELLVHLIFGKSPNDDELWFTMTAVPMDPQRHDFQPLIATDLLTANEMAELSAKMTSH